MNACSWTLITDKVPPGPAEGRVGLWRKIKGLGAVCEEMLDVYAHRVFAAQDENRAGP